MKGDPWLIQWMQLAAMLGVAAAGIGVVRTRDPAAQAVAVSFFGLLMAVTFFLYQAPDVALSQLVIGAVALPLMILLALARVRRADAERERAGGKEARPG